MSKYSVPVVIIGLLLICGCGLDSVTDSENHPPIIEALTAGPPIVLTGRATTVTCLVTDEDDDQISYVWSASGGSITENGESITWTAPAVPCTCVISVSVSDGSGESDADSLAVPVLEPVDPGEAVSVLVLDHPPAWALAFWDRLVDEYSQYGNTEISIDYLSLAHSGITYDELLSSGAEVILFSQSPTAVCTEDEIQAVSWYVQQGYGLFVTGGTLRPSEHWGLVSLLGYSSAARGQVCYACVSSDAIEIIDEHSELFRDIASYETSSKIIYSGGIYGGDDLHMRVREDWQDALVDPNAEIVAFILNSASWGDHSEPLCSPISCVNEPSYRAVFAGHSPADYTHATSDDYQFYYNALVFCADRSP